MARTFSGWKAWATVKLLSLKQKYRDNPKVLQDIDHLVNRLERLRLDSLSAFLADLHRASTDAPEFLEIVPKEEEVARWFEGGGEE
jgi:4-hydroxyphenylpyruvate dioxygenase-like putative hemolysin